MRISFQSMAKRKSSSTGKRKQKTPRRVTPEMRVYDSHAAADEGDRTYWMTQTPAARLRELERLRQLNFGYGEGNPRPRLQRVLRVAELGEG